MYYVISNCVKKCCICFYFRFVPYVSNAARKYFLHLQKKRFRIQGLNVMPLLYLYSESRIYFVSRISPFSSILNVYSNTETRERTAEEQKYLKKYCYLWDSLHV